MLCRHASDRIRLLRSGHKCGSTAGSDPAPMLKSESSSRDTGNAANRGAVGAAGEGIGLSIVKRLCELLDATLELETAPGAGTTFRVVLPCSYSSPAPP